MALTSLSTLDTDAQPKSTEGDQAIAQLLRLEEIEFLDRKLATAPTWPFDVQLLAKLVTIVLSVTAALAARLIATLGRF